MSSPALPSHQTANSSPQHMWTTWGSFCGPIKQCTVLLMFSSSGTCFDCEVRRYREVSLRPMSSISLKPDVIALPGSQPAEQTDSETADSAVAEETDAPFKSVAQISEELLTLSSLPRSRWATLSNLQQIRLRNKPKEPVQVPKSAPFFLPTIQGLSTSVKFDVAKEAAVAASKGSRILNFSAIDTRSIFQRTLCQSNQSGNFDPTMELLKSMSLASIDIEIRSLSAENDGEQLEAFINLGLSVLASRKDFELIQAYLHLFIQVQGDTIARTPRLASLLSDLIAEHERTWGRLEDLIQHSLCVVNFLKSTTL
eukprot:m.223757 g.223757  ORF g.223757 m.223757 type:complete len:312 (+) comp54188_c0_seq9:1927-2862(+)